MKIFQILNGFCHWQTPFKFLEETKGFPADCIFVEAPDYVNEQWGYDETKEGDERFIRPEEIAELAFYLMSDFGEIICGHTVVADGGDNAATL